MRDEFPESVPHAEHRLRCFVGQKVVRNYDVDLTDEDLRFEEAGRELKPEAFLKSQRQKYEEARVRAAMSNRLAEQEKKRPKTLTQKMRRARMKKKLARRERKSQFKTFMKEVKSRAGEGYSMAQLMDSHIPDIGGEVKVSEAQITAALQQEEAGGSTKIRGSGGIHFFFGRGFYWAAGGLRGHLPCRAKF